MENNKDSFHPKQLNNWNIISLISFIEFEYDEEYVTGRSRIRLV